MEPNDQVMELKRLETLRRTKHASGGRVPLWKGSMVESAPRQEMQKDIDMREGIYELYKKRKEKLEEKLDEYYKSSKFHDDSPLNPEVLDGPIQYADRPPKPELQIGPYVPELGHRGGYEDNFIEFDDGTVYYKDTGEFYDQEGKQVTSPSEGAKPVGETLEAAEGGRVSLSSGGVAGMLGE